MFSHLRLALRLVRGYGTLDRFRWLLATAASATAAALLLRALGHALSSPAGGDAAVDRLLWCLPALAAVGYLCAAWAGSLPLQRPQRMAGLIAAGATPSRMRLLLAGEVALACTLGSVLALLGFLVLRAHWLELIPGERLDPALGAGAGLPVAATVALLASVPLLAALAAAASVRTADLLPGHRPPSDPLDQTPRRLSLPYLVVALGLPVAGAAIELIAVRKGGGTVARIGWLMGAAGIAVAVPVLLYAAGALLAAGRPHAVRLLAGRGLQAESWRLGTPLAVVAVTGALGAVTAVRNASGHHLSGPLPLIEGVLLAVCVLGALLTRLAELVTERRTAYASLHRMGAGGRVLTRSAALRGSAATAVVLLAGSGAAALAAAALSS